jgi:LacI family transcriptional regulator
MVTKITDIAKEAGVSVTSVSFALNNKKGVSAELRKRIKETASSMAYKQTGAKFDENAETENRTVRFIKIAKHGHIVNERHNPFITEYMEGIETESKRRRIKLEVSFYNRTPIEDIVKMENENNADGIIVLGTELNAYEPGFFAKLKMPAVFIDAYFPLASFDCIDMDNTDGVYKAVEYLYNRGHRHISLVKSSYETRNFKMREIGFYEAMEYFSLAVRQDEIVSVDPEAEKSADGMRGYLEKRKQRLHHTPRDFPSAFVCMNDVISYGCVRALREHGFSVPHDVSVIGFDDLPSSAFFEPPLTSVRVSTQQIGARALQKLVVRMAVGIAGRRKDACENILVAGKLVVRESVRSL